jgi:GTPase SAR1 family protein
MPEMNIAVIGSDGVGKSTFVQRALDLPFPSPTKAADRKIPYDGTLYRIRLLEISIDDVDIDDDDTVSWPDSVADRMMPHIDGVLTLYDVADRSSIEDVPETLGKLLATCENNAQLMHTKTRKIMPLVLTTMSSRNTESLIAISTNLMQM